MKTATIVFGYLRWHYGKAMISLTKIWGNFFYFLTEFFSLKALFKNYFDPWKRMTDRYPKSFNLKEYFSAFITNLIVRIVGIIMRTLLIVVGLSSLILLILLYPVTLIIWLGLPFLVCLLLGLGLFLIIK